MTTRLKVDGKEVRVAVTRSRVIGYVNAVAWTWFYIYDEHGRAVAEHSVPSDWFENQNYGMTIETGGHKYEHVKAISQ